MRKYLATIHQRSPAHKKRFALLVSGGTTLIIFALWALVVFGGQSIQTSDNSNAVTVATAPVVNSNTPSPFDDVKGGVANVFEALKNQFDQVKQSATSIDIQNKYNEARDQALSN